MVEGLNQFFIRLTSIENIMDAQELDSSLEVELTELAANGADEEEVVTESVESKEPAKRGRPAIASKWSTVISLDHDDPPKMILRELAVDIALAQSERSVPNSRREREWAPIFCPRKFVSDQEATDLSMFKLTEAKLR